MDWLQFLASIVGPLAWPVVVLILLFMIRRQLGGLAENLTELSFPGGKAKFERELAKGRKVTDQLPVEITKEPNKPDDKDDTLRKVAVETPEGAVVLAYMEVERKLLQIAERLGKSSRIVNHMSVVKELTEKELLPPGATNLFHSLRAARNSAAHARTSIGTVDAFEYIDQAEVLAAVLDGVLENLPKKMAPK